MLCDFLLIIVAVPRLVATVKRIVCDQGFSFSGSYKKLSPAYESNVPFELRLMVDLDIPGCGWVELKANQFKLRNRNLVFICHFIHYFNFDREEDLMHLHHIANTKLI